MVAYLCNIPRKTWRQSLFFCLEINTKVFCKFTGLQYLYDISKKKLGIEFIFCMQINIKDSTNWHYRFWWNWPDITRYTKLVYCDAKRSSILWGWSHVCFYLFIVYTTCNYHSWQRVPNHPYFMKTPHCITVCVILLNDTVELLI